MVAICSSLSGRSKHQATENAAVTLNQKLLLISNKDNILNLTFPNFCFISNCVQKPHGETIVSTISCHCHSLLVNPSSGSLCLKCH